MVAGIFHEGSGLGNQLHRYVATKCISLDKGYGWGMVNPDLFKGFSFMDLNVYGDMSEKGGLSIEHKFEEKKVIENGVDIRSYDPEVNFIEDNTIIDGEFQDERYFEHRLPEIREWLKVEPLEMPDDLCIINLRGGEYKMFSELILSKSYWEHCISLMKKTNPQMRFQIHTDDKIYAQDMFPGFDVISDIGYNWRSIRYAKYLILSNSSFSILPSLLGNARIILAPKYHARHNIGIWALAQNFYKKYTYIDKKDYAK